MVGVCRAVTTDDDQRGVIEIGLCLAAQRMCDEGEAIRSKRPWMQSRKRSNECVGQIRCYDRPGIAARDRENLSRQGVPFEGRSVLAGFVGEPGRVGAWPGRELLDQPRRGEVAIDRLIRKHKINRKIGDGIPSPMRSRNSIARWFYVSFRAQSVNWWNRTSPQQTSSQSVDRPMEQR